MNSVQVIGSALEMMGGSSWRDLPLGAGIGEVYLEGCFTTDAAAELVSPSELAFGNFAPGRYGFLMTTLQVFKRPLPAKGKLGLWDWESAEWIREEELAK